MHRLKIKNFGPVEDVELNINDILIFIGSQAGGKSTISKAIYFFKSLRDELLQLLKESTGKHQFDRLTDAFTKKIRKKFLEILGSPTHSDPFELTYWYARDKYITLRLKESNYPEPEFSSQLRDCLKELSEKADELLSEILRENIPIASDRLAERTMIHNRIQKLVYRVFEDDTNHFFIPAGRMLPAILSEPFGNIELQGADFLTRDFADRMMISKPTFSKSPDELIQDKIHLTTDSIDMESVQYAQKLMGNILKGTYRVDAEGQKIFFDNRRFTRLAYSSSGQQEVLWIVLLAFLIILNRTKSAIVFEEPEAHLYPETQRELISLIALVTNTTASQVIITTHSPYILSSCNNLLYAHRVSKSKPEQVNAVVDQKIRLDPKKMSAYFLEKGRIRNILDEESGLIHTEAIDSASDIINAIHYQLFRLDDER